MKEENTSILVSSFDGYSMCWNAFCHGMEYYWPDCPYNIYFLTNFKEAPCGHSIKVGADQGWGKNLLKALEEINTPYIIYAQEDYWIKSAIDLSQIQHFINIIDRNLADYIRLSPYPPPQLEFAPDERLGIIDTNAPYRTSLQFAIWRKEVLQDLIEENETQWEFELEGTIRSRKYENRFLSVRSVDYGINYIFTAIVNGEWVQEAYDYAQQHHLQVEFQQLPQKTLSKKIQSGIRSSLYKHFKNFSRSSRRLKR